MFKFAQIVSELEVPKVGKFINICFVYRSYSLETSEEVGDIWFACGSICWPL